MFGAYCVQAFQPSCGKEEYSLLEMRDKSDPSDSNMQTQYVLIKEQKSDPTTYDLANIWDCSILIAF